MSMEIRSYKYPWAFSLIVPILQEKWKVVIEVIKNSYHINLLGRFLLLLTCFMFNLCGNVLAQNSEAPYFISNEGQWPDSVLFVCNSGSRALWFTESGVHFKFVRNVPSEAASRSTGFSGMSDRSKTMKKFNFDPGHLEYHTISTKFVGANYGEPVYGKNKLSFYINFYKGNDPSKWKSHVPVFESITYENIYPGIDLKYYGKQKKVEYDFMVSPGANPSQIRIKYDGIKSLHLSDDGDLIIETEWGQISESRPYVYQITDGKKKEIRASFKLHSPSEVKFELLESYDYKSTLILDPVLSYSTYFGDYSVDYALSIDLDSQGNMLITGFTHLPFPTFNAIDSTWNGDWDVFITKISSSGQELIFSTFLGGRFSEWGYAAKIDNFDNIYIAGYTGSEDFPSQGGFDTTQNIGTDDGFLVKFTPECDSIIYSTFVGGSGLDWIYGLDVDNDGYAYVCGVTNSPDLDFLTAYNREIVGSFDAFLVKVSPGGDTASFGTFLGSSSGDAAFDVCVDESGNAFITGSAGADDFPISNPAHQALNGSSADVFVAQFSTNDSSLVYSLVMGGISDDEAFDIDIDAFGNAYITGRAGGGFPMINAYDSTYNFGVDLFFAKIEAETGNPIFTSYLGGRFEEYGYCIAVDEENRIWLSGSTWSDNFPTYSAYDDTHNGRADIYLACLSPSGSQLLFSTYLGGSDWDDGLAMILDTMRNVYITGRSQSPDFPTINPIQAEYGATNDVIIAKFSEVTTSIEEYSDSILPVRYILSNNYPNPFNPTTTISYSLPEKSYVEIIIYNVLGKEVTRLVKNIKSAGNYTITWNGTDRKGSIVATGVYIYQLVAGKYTESKKMLLLR